MAEAASDNDLLIHLHVWLSIKCERCRLWEQFIDCWDGVEAGAAGAMEYTRRAAAQAKREGWLLLNDGTAICPQCQESRTNSI